jgi:alpha-tubulin suppressor-like RCC1 family protein
VIGLTDAVSIDVGAQHACAVRSDRTAVCWGENGSSELGNATFADSDVPIPVAGVADVETISASESTTCALIGSGAVYCWGYGRDGQLGVGARLDSSSEPLEVVLPDDAVELRTGHGHGCVRHASGTMSCWGVSPNGELGIGTLGGFEVTPMSVMGIAGATEIVCGHHVTCARRGASPLLCWGFNEAGQVGNGDRNDQPLPVAVIGLP